MVLVVRIRMLSIAPGLILVRRVLTVRMTMGPLLQWWVSLVLTIVRGFLMLRLTVPFRLRRRLVCPVAIILRLSLEVTMLYRLEILSERRRMPRLNEAWQ